MRSDSTDSARIAWSSDYPIGVSREAFEVDIDRLVSGWGTTDYAKMWATGEMPSRAEDAEFLCWLAKMMRHAASSAAALEFHNVWYATDVRAILGSIQAPTLVMAGEQFMGAPTTNSEVGVRVQCPHRDAPEIPAAARAPLPVGLAPSSSCWTCVSISGPIAPDFTH